VQDIRLLNIYFNLCLTAEMGARPHTYIIYLVTTISGRISLKVLWYSSLYLKSPSTGII